MIELDIFTVVIPEEGDDFDTMMLKFNEQYVWTNARGKTWIFDKGEASDGMSMWVFRHYGQFLLPALAHDQDCINAKTYAERREGDRQFKANMKDLGASKWFYTRRYLGVSAYAQWMRIKGDFR